ncbi:MAG TPA: hypothetical protein VGN97_17925 [Mesorhizobium sp.]|jgi:hypothetical protein|nr:hypothetical protein [Mesorhizobium sp.]
MPVNVNRTAETARAAKPNAAVVSSTLKATGLLPRALPKTTRLAAVKPETTKRAIEAAAPVAAKQAQPANTISPSFARMAACMRFRGYIGS